MNVSELEGTDGQDDRSKKRNKQQQQQYEYRWEQQKQRIRQVGGALSTVMVVLALLILTMTTITYLYDTHSNSSNVRYSTTKTIQHSPNYMRSPASSSNTIPFLSLEDNSTTIVVVHSVDKENSSTVDQHHLLHKQLSLRNESEVQSQNTRRMIESVQQLQMDDSTSTKKDDKTSTNNNSTIVMESIYNKKNDHTNTQQNHNHNSTAFPRIIGGLVATNELYPWYGVAAGDNLCGATLIHEDIMITAAHCLGTFLSRGVYVGGIRVDGKDAIEYTLIEQEYPHQNYNMNTDANDIMLMKLKTSLVNVPIVTLNFNSVVPEDDDSVTVIGFGYISEDGPFSNNLLETTINIINTDVCQTIHPNLIPDQMVCAGVIDGSRDTCRGDSGGPLLSSQDLTTTTQVGITSFGTGCGRPNSPAVYTRISAYQKWIQDGICTLSNNPYDNTICQQVAGSFIPTNTSAPLTLSPGTPPTPSTITITPDVDETIAPTPGSFVLPPTFLIPPTLNPTVVQTSIPSLSPLSSSVPTRTPTTPPSKQPTLKPRSVPTTRRPISKSKPTMKPSGLQPTRLPVTKRTEQPTMPPTRRTPYVTPSNKPEVGDNPFFEKDARYYLTFDNEQERIDGIFTLTVSPMEMGQNQIKKSYKKKRTHSILTNDLLFDRTIIKRNSTSIDFHYSKDRNKTDDSNSIVDSAVPREQSPDVFMISLSEQQNQTNHDSSIIGPESVLEDSSILLTKTSRNKYDVSLQDTKDDGKNQKPNIFHHNKTDNKIKEISYDENSTSILLLVDHTTAAKLTNSIAAISAKNENVKSRNGSTTPTYSPTTQVVSHLDNTTILTYHEANNNKGIESRFNKNENSKTIKKESDQKPTSTIEDIIDALESQFLRSFLLYVRKRIHFIGKRIMQRDQPS